MRALVSGDRRRLPTTMRVWFVTSAFSPPFFMYSDHRTVP
jgi:hypothetical protein